MGLVKSLRLSRGVSCVGVRATAYPSRVAVGVWVASDPVCVCIREVSRVP